MRRHILANQLARKKVELTTLQNAHRKLKVYNLKKAKYSATVPKAKYQQTLAKLKDLDETVKSLQQDNLILKEVIEESKNTEGTKSKMDGKTYSSSMRMRVYHCITNKVPTANIPILQET